MVSGWTNQAQHPSNVRERGPEVAHHLMDLLDVPQCAQVPLASVVIDRANERPLFVGNTMVWAFPESRDVTNRESFDTTMVMTFRKDGHDYVGTVRPDLQESFVAELYTYTCDNTTTHIAYMPKCGNLALLNPITEVDGRAISYTGYFPKDPVELPEPGTALLVIGGLIVARLIHLLKNHRTPSSNGR